MKILSHLLARGVPAFGQYEHLDMFSKKVDLNKTGNAHDRLCQEEARPASGSQLWKIFRLLAVGHLTRQVAEDTY
jgi:hypothetical protein